MYLNVWALPQGDLQEEPKEAFKRNPRGPCSFPGPPPPIFGIRRTHAYAQSPFCVTVRSAGLDAWPPVSGPVCPCLLSLSVIASCPCLWLSLPPVPVYPAPVPVPSVAASCPCLRSLSIPCNLTRYVLVHFFRCRRQSSKRKLFHRQSLLWIVWTSPHTHTYIYIYIHSAYT